MELPRNAFKHAIAAARLQIGLWSTLGSALVAEIVAGSGFDWIVIDMEHSPNELPGVMAQLQAMKGGTATPVVRIPWNDPVTVKRALDIGAPGLLFPFVQNAAEARAAVAATRYPPHGIRGVAGTTRAGGFGRIKGYFADCAREICVLVQVETVAALAKLEEIAAVEGVDGVFIGPSDLSAAMGHLGNAAHADVQAAILGVPQRLAASGKAGGILAPVQADAKRYIEAGFKFVAVGSDMSLVARHSEALCAAFKSPA